MSLDQDTIVNECFEGQRFRNCDYCPAHHSRGGTCCFGHKHENDEECRACPYEEDCAKETATHNRLKFGRSEHRSNPNKIVLHKSSSFRKNQGPLLSHVPKKQKVEKSEQVEENPPSGLNARFLSFVGGIAIWGAFEGAMELVLDYLRRNRPWI